MPSLPRRKSRTLRRKRSTLRSRKRILRTRRSRGGVAGPPDLYGRNENVYAVLGHANNDSMNAFKSLMPLSLYEGRELIDITKLRLAIEELSHDIQTDHAELMQGELPEDYVKYKELFIRRRLYLLDRLVDSIQDIINNKGDPTFKADAQDDVDLVNETMEEMKPIRTAFRRSR
jgi:hypothetical protein